MRGRGLESAATCDKEEVSRIVPWNSKGESTQCLRKERGKMVWKQQWGAKVILTLPQGPGMKAGKRTAHFRGCKGSNSFTGSMSPYLSFPYCIFTPPGCLSTVAVLFEPACDAEIGNFNPNHITFDSFSLPVTKQVYIFHLHICILNWPLKALLTKSCNSFHCEVISLGRLTKSVFRFLCHLFRQYIRWPL